VYDRSANGFSETMGYYVFDYASFNQTANALVKAGIVLSYSTPNLNVTRTILGNRDFTVTL